MKKPHPFGEEQLANLLPPHTDRHQHTLGVVERMKELLSYLSLPEKVSFQLQQACYLHDIGYSPQLALHGFHPLDGAIFASREGYDKSVVASILYHSLAFELAQSMHKELVPIFEKNRNFLDEQDRHWIDLVTLCDLHTSPTGKPITLDERVEDIVKRYGGNHPISQLMTHYQPRMQETLQRLEAQMGRRMGWS